ncbi:radical SAM protein, partial [Streptococcus pneumoniae]
MNFQLAKYSLLKKFSENIGFTTPEEYGAIFKYLIENVKTDRQIIYSPHCHDDLGMAVANSLAAVKNGA